MGREKIWKTSSGLLTWRRKQAPMRRGWVVQPCSSCRKCVPWKLRSLSRALRAAAQAHRSSGVSSGPGGGTGSFRAAMYSCSQAISSETRRCWAL